MPASSTAIRRAFEPTQDLVERLARHLRIDAAQHVVGAEFDDHRLGASGTDQSSRARPPEAVSPETPALAISTARPLAGERLLEPGRKGGVGRKPVAGGQRIAERHDLDRRSAALAGKTTAAAAIMAATTMATTTARATIWTRAPKAPYERGDADPAAPDPGRNE